MRLLPERPPVMITATKRVITPPSPVVKEAGHAYPLPNMDAMAAMNGGFRNLLTGAGTDSDKQTASGFVLSAELSRYQLDTIFYESWAAKKFITIPVEDALVRWRVFEERATEMREAEEKYNLRARIARAWQAARLYGGSIIVAVTKNSPLSEPLDISTMIKGDLANLLVLSKWDVRCKEADPDVYSESYQQPLVWAARREDGTEVDIHASRTVRFDGLRPPSELFFGRSMLQPVMVAILQDAEMAQNISHLGEEASLSVYKAEGLKRVLAGAPLDKEIADPMQSLAASSSTASIFRMHIIDSEDELERVNYPFSGIPDVLDRFAQRLAAAADIPSTRFMGQAPIGLNSTGQSDFANYALMVEAKQRDNLDEPLELLDQIIARSEGLGEPPPYHWVSLVDLGEKVEVDIAAKRAEIVFQALDRTAIDEEEARDILSDNIIFGNLPDNPSLLEDARELREQGPPDDPLIPPPEDEEE